MPEHFSDLIKRGAPAEHVHRQTMAQQVRALSCRDHSCFCQGCFDDARNGTPTFEPVDGSLISEEHSTTGASRPIMAQITRNGSCDIRRERQLRPFSTFPAHRDSCVFPIDIFEVESDDFTRPQAKPREQKQDGVIASSHRRASVAMMQNLPYLSGRQMFGANRERPTCHFRNDQREIPVNQAPVMQINAKMTALLLLNFSLVLDRVGARAAAQTRSHRADAVWTDLVDHYQTSQTRTS